jgi:2-dehydro-3-deoxyphosphooctonate aldolase (KDO 8-P synthase)
MSKTITIGKIKIGGKQPFALIAGPCVIENRAMALHLAKSIKAICRRNGIPYIFKASYDKANRTSIKSFRGLGLKKGLAVLQEVKEKVGVPVLSDVHSLFEATEAARVLDVIQIPAFLCRQTDLLVGAALTGKVVNVKKGQFMAPADMAHAVKKIEQAGNKRILLTERGSSFGYNNLVSDFRSIPIMQQTRYPVIFDATHSVQQPGGLGSASGGSSEYIPLLSRCAIAAGANALFLEVHTNPKKALSDGPNMIALNKLEKLLKELKRIESAVK